MQGLGAGAGKSRPFLRGAEAGLKKNGRLRLLLDIGKIEYFLGKIQLET